MSPPRNVFEGISVKLSSMRAAAHRMSRFKIGGVRSGYIARTFDRPLPRPPGTSNWRPWQARK